MLKYTDILSFKKRKYSQTQFTFGTLNQKNYCINVVMSNRRTQPIFVVCVEKRRKVITEQQILSITLTTPTSFSVSILKKRKTFESDDRQKKTRYKDLELFCVSP